MNNDPGIFIIFALYLIALRNPSSWRYESWSANNFHGSDVSGVRLCNTVDFLSSEKKFIDKNSSIKFHGFTGSTLKNGGIKAEPGVTSGFSIHRIDMKTSNRRSWEVSDSYSVRLIHHLVWKPGRFNERHLPECILKLLSTNLSMKGYPCLIQHLLLILVAKYCIDQRTFAGARNITNHYKNIEEVIHDRHSILKQIARSKLEGFYRGDCNTSSVVVITKGQYGEHKWLQWNDLLLLAKANQIIHYLSCHHIQCQSSLLLRKLWE